MQEVRPSEEFKQFKFECPKCQWPFWVTTNQLKHPKFILVCDCNGGTIFKPKSNKIEEERPVISSPISEQAIRVMVAQGYNYDEARQRIIKVYVDGKTLPQLVKEAVFVRNIA